MRFFIHVHRSIVDPSFYAEIIEYPKRRAFLFLVQVILITIVISALAHTFRAYNSETGLPAVLPALFQGMELSHDEMVTSQETPYSVNPVFVADFMAVMTELPRSSFTIPESSIVVNDKILEKPQDQLTVSILFGSKEIYYKMGPNLIFPIPYSAMLAKNEVLRFDTPGVTSFLSKRIPLAFIYFLVQHFIRFGATILTSLFYLSFAVFIFRLKRLTLGNIIKIAMFAMVPLALVKIITSLAGVAVKGVWYVAMFACIIIIGRAIQYIIKNDTTISQKEQ